MVGVWVGAGDDGLEGVVGAGDGAAGALCGAAGVVIGVAWVVTGAACVVTGAAEVLTAVLELWCTAGFLAGFLGWTLWGLAVVVVVAYSFVVSWILAFIIDKVMGMRISDDEELEGMDAVLHGETAYDASGLSGGGVVTAARTGARREEADVAEEVRA